MMACDDGQLPWKQCADGWRLSLSGISAWVYEVEDGGGNYVGDYEGTIRVGTFSCECDVRASATDVMFEIEVLIRSLTRAGVDRMSGRAKRYRDIRAMEREAEEARQKAREEERKAKGCSVEGCPHNAKAGGLCRHHANPCIMLNCVYEGEFDGLCTKHENHMRKHGAPWINRVPLPEGMKRVQVGITAVSVESVGVTNSSILGQPGQPGQPGM